MLGSMLLESSDLGEGQLASPVDALEHARGHRLVFDLMSPHASDSTFHSFAAKLTQTNLLGSSWR